MKENQVIVFLITHLLGSRWVDGWVGSSILRLYLISPHGLPCSPCLPFPHPHNTYRATIKKRNGGDRRYLKYKSKSKKKVIRSIFILVLPSRESHKLEATLAHISKVKKERREREGRGG